MILISLLIQVHLTNNETSIKKFVYLMINDIERQNNIKKSIESTKTYNHCIAREFTAHSVRARSNRLIESTIKNLRWLLENHKKLSQISNTLLWRLNTLTNNLTTYYWASFFTRSSTLHHDSIICEYLTRSL